MPSQEENELLTRTGPGTPAGELLRRYWQPAALAQELPPGGPPVPIRLLNEDLVLFRDDQGRPGLLGLHCSHRGADLSYGRIEDGGLRCIYHGWLYDIKGRCLEQPGEPAGSTFHEKIGHRAYPCREAGDVIFAYLGPGEPPQIPAYDFLTAPEGYRIASKIFQDCNYLQGNEGNHDPSHQSYLHRRLNGNSYTAMDGSPAIEIEETDFGAVIYGIRKAQDGKQYVRTRCFVLPNLTAVNGGGGDGYQANWHVPIDDTHHWRYILEFKRNRLIDREAENARTRLVVGSDYHLIRNAANRYHQNREEMKTLTFSGVGMDFRPEDTLATGSAGPIQDRTQEHLGYTDRAIIATRKVLLHAIREVEAGREPPHVIRDGASNHFPDLMVRADVIPGSADWRRYWANESAILEPAGPRG